jgi:hypothetical protein
MATSTSTFENEGEGEAPSTPGGSLSTRHKNSGLGPAVVSSARLKELEPPGIDDPVVVDQGHSGHEDAHDEHEHAHAPAKPPETPAEWALWCTTGIISGLINGMLIFVFCCVYGSLIFVSRPFPSWNRSMLTEIYLCHACSCQEILRAETAGQGQNDALQPFITYGVSFQAAAAMISGLVGAIGSGAGAMICGGCSGRAHSLVHACRSVPDAPTRARWLRRPGHQPRNLPGCDGGGHQLAAPAHRRRQARVRLRRHQRGSHINHEE